MLNQADGTLCDRGMEQTQVNSDVRVFVYHIHEHIANRYSDAKLLTALADEGFFLCFARLNLPADIFP